MILLIICLVLLNAFFAASEIAFISLNDAKIEKQAKEGNKKAKKIYEMLENPSKFLATIQIGITLAGFLSSAYASESFASEIAPVLNSKIPAISLTAWNNISIVLITIVLSFFTLIFGELVPKRIAMKYSEKIAFSTIGIIRGISIITTPFVKLLTASTNIISKLFGVSETDEEIVTEEEIRMMVDVGEENGTIEEDEKTMINNVFEFDNKVVSEIMVPRPEIFALDMNLSVAEAIEEFSTANLKFSRVPIYEETIDHIKGIIYLKDILLAKNKSTKIHKLMRESYFVYENRPIDELFEELRKNRKQIAIVVDEYGGTSGIVTMEDILEEIVGEIYDEYDKEEEPIKQINTDTFEFAGSVAIFDVEEKMNIKIEAGQNDTISGFLLEKLGRVPSKKDKGLKVETDDAIYEIENIKDNHILKVKITKIKDENPDL